MEEYRTIARYPEYEISRSGNVRRKKTKAIRSITKVNGHPKIILKGHTEYISRLVAETYISNPDSKTDVSHIDRDKENCDVTNIKWATHSETQRASYFRGIDAPSGRGKPKSIMIIETGKVYPSINACARDINGSSSGIRQCLNGQIKSYKHYHFKIIF